MTNCISLIFIIVFNVSYVAAQTTVNIAAAADNTIYQNPPGNSNALGQNMLSGTNGGNSPRRGLIRFDVAAVVPPGAMITSVVVTLHCNLSRAVPDNVSLHKLSADWGEGTSNAGSASDGSGVAATTNDATWLTTSFPATAWTTGGGDYVPVASATISIGNTGFYQWTSAGLITDVQSWIATPPANFGWILICNETTASTARKFGSRENATVVNRPSLSVTYTTTLPVTLNYFKASIINNAVALRWETSQQINNDFFEVLHSVDGSVFSSVGKIKGHGTSLLKHEYNLIHRINTTGNHFYKLAQVDFDGTRKYSSVERVYISAITDNVQIFPNPVLHEFAISTTGDWQNTTYSIFNVCGTKIQTGTVGPAPVKVWNLKTGVYYLCFYKNKILVNKIVFSKI